MVLEYHELGVQFSFLLSNTALAKSYDDFLKWEKKTCHKVMSYPPYITESITPKIALSQIMCKCSKCEMYFDIW